ncbi:Hypothetical_protein [Hexamita inflata]|uniref:Hypothetical_protein n=1 Tax=Hexamita inflata TaxID=28002 RepID=A0AA86TXH2_9EUKA|nr:Hypothetical protein HINF_LOCUS20805 [Hexamita inflata]
MFSAQIGFNRNILESTGSTKDYYAPWKYTFSKLGSFDEQYNPKYYLLFSVLALLNNGVLMFIDNNQIRCIKNSGKKQFKCSNKIIIAANIMIVIIISTAITQSIDTTGQKQWIQYLLGFELWENIIIFAIITSLLWNAMILPIDIQNINLSKQIKE